jgi:hypothetical protein
MFKKHYLLAMVLLLPFQLFSQSCPDDQTGWTIDEDVLYEPFPFDFFGGAEFDYISTTNTVEIKPDWTTINLLDIYGFTEEEIKPMLIQAMAHTIWGSCTSMSSKTLTIYEEVDCVQQLTCHLEVDFEKDTLCQSPNWYGGDPAWFFHNGNTYRTFTQENVCGTTCCKTIYELGCKSSLTSFNNLYTIEDMYKISDPCPESTTLDCLTQDTIPCLPVCN